MTSLSDRLVKLEEGLEIVESRIDHLEDKLDIVIDTLGRLPE